jgi:hypothetical protein
MELFVVTAYYRETGVDLVGVFDNFKDADAASDQYLLDNKTVVSCGVRSATLNEYRDWT